jgi:HAD superfamily hydrolase (TIGR01549 family)
MYETDNRWHADGLDVTRVRAITLDLDDTLWPIWPTIERAEQVLLAWLAEHAPATAARCAGTDRMRQARAAVAEAYPHLVHDLSALRREAIRHVLRDSGDDPALAEPAFEIFFAERQRVTLFHDALPALRRLGARFPLVALSNGNADLQRVGIATHFRGAVSAREFGVAKPDVRIFHAAAAAAGAEPGEVLHVGDDAALDGMGALRAGMQLAWVNRAGHDWGFEPWRPHATVPDLLVLCRLLGV